MASVQDNLTKLLNTKNAIRQKIISLGVDVPINTPFGKYSDFIEQIAHAEFEETTTDQDLLQLIDLYHYLGSAEYEDHTYTDKELQDLHNVLSGIVDGVTGEGIKENSPYLLISSQGRTNYFVDDTFSLDGYKIFLVETDKIIDVTEFCNFVPNHPLTLEDKHITINYELNGSTLGVVQPVNIKVYNPYIEYIESDGAQYIDTGFKHNQNTRFELDWYLAVHRNWGNVIGSYGGAKGTNKLFFLGTDANNKYYGQYGSSAVTLNASSVGRHTADFNKNILLLDGVKYTYTANTFQSDYNFIIFGVTNYEGLVASSPCRIYSCKLYDNGTLIRDFVPYVTREGVYCLYDKIEEKCYYNQGTGKFKGGPEII